MRLKPHLVPSNELHGVSWRAGKLQKKNGFPTATFDDTAMGTGWCPPVMFVGL